MEGKVYRNIHVCLGRQLQEAESVLARDGDGTPITNSPACEQELLAENYLEVILFSSLGMKHCHSCRGEIV